MSRNWSMPGKDGRHRVTMEGYGYRWFHLEPVS
jgi:hypothetical protein